MSARKYDESPFATLPASEIQPGHAVVVEIDETRILCLKVQREAKNYMQDYVVRLEPPAVPEVILEYFDPEKEVADCGGPLVFKRDTASRRPTGIYAQPGDLVEAEDRLFLAVREKTKLHSFIAFIDVATGNAKRVRERAIESVYSDWSIVGLKGPAACGIEALRTRIATDR